MIALRRTLLLALLAFALIFPWLFSNPAIIAMAFFTLLFAAAASGWNIFSGYTGSTALGHGAFFGIGAYALALLSQDWHLQGDYTPLLLIPLVGLLACAFAVPLGWIILRTQGQVFVVCTIASFYIAQLMAYNLRSITNGSTGLSLPIPSWNSDFFNVPFYFVTLATLLLALAVSRRVRTSKYGLGLLALRDDEDRARGLGVRAGPSKLVAFVISAFFSGACGGIYAYYFGSVYPPFAFDPTFSIALALISFLGGIGTLTGPLVGAVLVVPVQQYLVVQYGENGLYQVIYGLFFLLILLLLPQGIVPAFQQRWSRLLASRGRDNGTATARGKGKIVPCFLKVRRQDRDEPPQEPEQAARITSAGKAGD